MYHAQIAYDAGVDAAAQVAVGTMTPEQAGDSWVAFADSSHELGEAFLRAYDAAGGRR